MSGIATAIVVSTAGGMYMSGRSADAAESAAGTAASAEERIAAQNAALNEERFREARQVMSPYLQSSATANTQLQRELGLNTGSYAYDPEAYVSGRDDISGVTGAPGGTFAPGTGGAGGRQGTSTYADPINPRTGEVWTAQDEAQTPQEESIKSHIQTLMGSYSEQYGTPEDYLNSPQIQGSLLLDPSGFAGRVSNSMETVMQEQAQGRQNPYLDAYNPQDVMQDFGAMAPGGQPYLDQQTGGELGDYFSSLAPGESLYRDQQEQIDPSQYFSDLTSGWEEFTANPIYQSMIDAGAKTALGSKAAGGMARSGATLEALRDVGQETSLGFFNTYMGTMGDLTGINEERRRADMAAEEQRYANYLNIGEGRYGNVQNINEQRFANAINMGEARRVGTENINEQRYANYMNRDEQRMINEQNTQESRYVNYMNMLQNMADPSTATNMASLGVNQGITAGNQAAQSVANINQYNLGATAASNAARADMAGGAMNLASAYIGSQGYNPAQSTPYMPQTSGTIYGGANAPRPTSYAGYA